MKRDKDGRRQIENLERAYRAATRHALDRGRLTLSECKTWHRAIMAGLPLKDNLGPRVSAADVPGNLRGSGQLLGIETGIGAFPGTASQQVAVECAAFEAKLQKLIVTLDGFWPVERFQDLDEDGVQAIAEAAAWAHCECVRIHPFADGNGRLARLLGNTILIRYGLPPVFRLRPRPDGAYSAAALQSMYGDRGPMLHYVLAQLQQFTG